MITIIIFLSIVISCKDNGTGGNNDNQKPPKEVKRVTDVKSYAGKHRIKLSWRYFKNSDVNKTKIYWNDGADSVEVSADTSVARDSVIIDKLDEKEYTFTLIVLGSSGNSSSGVLESAKAFGSDYQSTISNRAVLDARYNLDAQTVDITWGGASKDVVITKLSYSDSFGKTRKIEVAPTVNKTSLDDYRTSRDTIKFSYRTLYLPEPTSIDTFYSEEKEVKLSGNNIDSDKYFIKNQADFDQYKNFEFPAGALILFKQGAIFNGQFTPSGSGDANNPITVTSYDSSTGEVSYDDAMNKPVIAGHGDVDFVFKLNNSEYWTISNLEITNTDNAGTGKGHRQGVGIAVTAKDNGVNKHIIIKNNYVHDLYGHTEASTFSGPHSIGIFVGVRGSSTQTKFDDVLIENNVVEHTAGSGITTHTTWGHSIPGIDDPFVPVTNVVMRGNYVSYVGRAALHPTCSEGAVVEYNTMPYSGRIDPTNSLVSYNNKNTLIQYNEAYGNSPSGKPEQHDRAGFDVDYYNNGITIQYNYDHDNNWFVVAGSKYVNDVVVRYNIAQNERRALYAFGQQPPGVDGWSIYNNTHYFSTGNGRSIFYKYGNLSGQDHLKDVVFTNNIFYFGSQGAEGYAPGNTSYTNNIFYNMPSKGSQAITADPMLVNPGQGGTDIDFKDANRLPGYRLQSGSPAIDAGITVPNNGGQDFWGNPLYNGTPDIGAQEY